MKGANGLKLPARFVKSPPVICFEIASDRSLIINKSARGYQVTKWQNHLRQIWLFRFSQTGLAIWTANIFRISYREVITDN